MNSGHANPSLLTKSVWIEGGTSRVITCGDALTNAKPTISPGHTWYIYALPRGGFAALSPEAHQEADSIAEALAKGLGFDPDSIEQATKAPVKKLGNSMGFFLSKWEDEVGVYEGMECYVDGTSGVVCIVPYMNTNEADFRNALAKVAEVDAQNTVHYNNDF